jgi:hypothetical protein
LLLCPLSTKVVAHGKLGAAQRWAMTQAIAAHMDWTNEVLGRCGISVRLEPPGSFEFKGPPSATLLSLGDDLGMLPDSSDVTVVDEGRVLRPFRGNGLMEPVIAASRLSDFLATQGLQCQVIANPRRSSQAFASADMACHHSDGSLARLSVEAKTSAGAISVASIDLRDGLSCYLPDAASTGSTEQRALVHLDRPSPPKVVRLVIVDKLSCSHLLGQSFADHPDSPLWGTIILDRRGLARGRQTFTLAHELGHVLLGTSSHPEDHGIADKDLLMNSLSSSIYLGPHRILRAQCEIMRRSPLLVSPQR